MQTQATVKYHHAPTRGARIRNTGNKEKETPSYRWWPAGWGEFQITYSTVSLYPKYIKNSQKSTIRKRHTFKKWAKDMNTSPKKVCGWQYCTCKDVQCHQPLGTYNIPRRGKSARKPKVKPGTMPSADRGIESGPLMRAGTKYWQVCLFVLNSC